MKILLVDDSRSMAVVFASRLEEFGNELCLAENGQVAVEKFKEFAPDLVLMDIEMPVMNGFEATSLIRNFEVSQKWAWTPIIFLTGSGTTENIVAAIDAGGDDVLAKDAPEPVLRAKMKAMSRVAGLRQDLLVANIKMQEDIKRREAAEEELRKRYAELTELNAKLSKVQAQLIQSEKLASVGVLAAGVAHEINNPIGFVRSNIASFGKYLEKLGELKERLNEAPAAWSDLGFDYLLEDGSDLVRESLEGIDRVKKIVLDLKNFSHHEDQEAWCTTDLHREIDTTLNLLANEIRGKAEIIKEYGTLPEVECLPVQLNQVFMALLSNSLYAMGDKPGRIRIRSGAAGDKVWLDIQDSGCGIPVDIQEKIFDPFFTTKPVGKGAGMGLSMSYGVIQNHHGKIEFRSEPGKGSVFRITLPVKQS